VKQCLELVAEAGEAEGGRDGGREARVGKSVNCTPLQSTSENEKAARGISIRIYVQ